MKDSNSDAMKVGNDMKDMEEREIQVGTHLVKLNKRTKGKLRACLSSLVQDRGFKLKERQKFDDPIEHVLSIAEQPDNVGRPVLFAISVIGSDVDVVGVITDVSPAIVQIKVYLNSLAKGWEPMDQPPVAIRREVVTTAALTFKSKFGVMS